MYTELRLPGAASRRCPVGNGEGRPFQAWKALSRSQGASTERLQLRGSTSGDVKRAAEVEVVLGEKAMGTARTYVLLGRYSGVVLQIWLTFMGGRQATIHRET